MSRQATDWRNLLGKDTSDSGPLSKISRALLKLINKMRITQLKDRQEIQTDTSLNKHTNRWSTSYVTREMQINTNIRYHYTPVRMAKI